MMPHEPHRLHRMFCPQSVAVVGASVRPGVGRTVLESLSSSRYSGKVSAVNPKYDEVAGYTCVDSLVHVSDPPDVVVAAVGRDLVPDVVDEAARIGAGSCIVFATGFGEVGDRGAAAQARVARAAASANMPVLGPNCQGLLNFAHQAPLWLDTVNPYPAGSVGLIAQSGSVATALVNNRRGVRWSRVVSSGNEVTVTCAELLEYLVGCEDTHVICAFLESVRDPDRFFAACDRAFEAGKPVIVCKTGRTEAARQATQSHSGALAAPDRLVDALFARHHVIRVDSLDELLNTAAAFRTSRRPRRGRVAALAASGGQIELLHDAMAGTNLELATLTQETTTQLRAILPAELDATNPLDYWGTPDLDRNLTKLVSTVAGDDDVGVVLLLGDFSTYPTGTRSRAAPLLGAAEAAVAKVEPLLVVLDLVGGLAEPDRVEDAARQGIVVSGGLNDSLRAIEHLVNHNAVPSPESGAQEPDIDVQTREVAAVWASSAPVVSGRRALRVVDSIGIDTPLSALVRTHSEALDAAEHIGYPMVAKIGAEHLLHRTEHGGVITGIGNTAELRDAVATLGRMHGGDVLLQEQVLGGVELYLGLRWEEGLGGFLIAGSGGIWTELADDVAIRPLGLSPADPRDMLSSLRCWPRLVGARGQQSVNLASVEGALLTLDRLGQTAGARLSELDINPLIVTAERGCAVDATFVLGTGGS